MAVCQTPLYRHLSFSSSFKYLWSCSRSGELRTQKLKSHLLRTQILKVLPLNPGVGQYSHATLTARVFFLAQSTHLVHSPAFSKTSPNFFLCWLQRPLVPVQARRMKQVTLLDAGSRVECPRNINRLKTKHKQNKNNMTCGKVTFEMTNLETE